MGLLGEGGGHKDISPQRGTGEPVGATWSHVTVTERNAGKPLLYE